MIALDSSVLVGFIRAERDVVRLEGLLLTEECAVGAPTLVETRAWCSINLKARSSRWLEDFVTAGPVQVVSFTREMADVASRAFNRFGRGSGHPAKLNLGDCMAYAVSTVLRAPLLFKGSEFGMTDVMAHPDSIV